MPEESLEYILFLLSVMTSYEQEECYHVAKQGLEYNDKDCNIRRKRTVKENLAY